MNTDEAEIRLSALVIDDEPQILRLLSIALESAGYQVVTAETGFKGLSLASQKRHDIVILDLGLPDVTGISVLRQLREWTQTPVIVLTVRDDEADQIEALDLGADDYVTKPFRSGEFLARIRSALRRANSSKDGKAIITVGDLSVDFTNRRVTRGGQPVKLTSTEYALLKLFIQNAGRVLTHPHILREIWGPEHAKQTPYLRVYMTRLRDKLEPDPDNPALFLTETGVGYRFVEQP